MDEIELHLEPEAPRERWVEQLRVVGGRLRVLEHPHVLGPLRRQAAGSAVRADPHDHAVRTRERLGTRVAHAAQPAGAVEALRPVHRAPEAAKAVPPEQSHLGVVVIWSRWRLLQLQRP